jgi:transcriptional regulator with XRE-family HTH domain
MEKLKLYIAEHGLSAREFAQRVGMSPAGLHGLMNKRNSPSLAVAFAIEDATGGAVPARSWLDT